MGNLENVIGFWTNLDASVFYKRGVRVEIEMVDRYLS